MANHRLQGLPVIALCHYAQKIRVSRVINDPAVMKLFFTVVEQPLAEFMGYCVTPPCTPLTNPEVKSDFASQPNNFSENSGLR